MRNVLTISVAIFGIVSCGPRTQVVELGRCWSTSIGEHVYGRALLYAFDDPECVECGAFLAAVGECKATAISIGSQQAELTYQRLLQVSPKNDIGMISTPVSFSGVTVKGGGKHGLMVRIDRLEPHGRR